MFVHLWFERGWGGSWLIFMDPNRCAHPLPWFEAFTQLLDRQNVSLFLTIIWYDSSAFYSGCLVYVL